MQGYSEDCVIPAYSEPWYNHNPGIFRTKGIFRTLTYSEQRHGVTRRRSTKRLQHTGNMSRKNLQLKGDC